MNDPAFLDQLFRTAVSSIDAGDVGALQLLLLEHPRLLRERLDTPALVAPGTPGHWLRDAIGSAADGFFHRPYLLWFIAEDPVRNDTLPWNIAQVADTIIQAARRAAVDTLQEQLDYALRLVSWSWVARRCGVQVALIDVLIDAGANACGPNHDALVNGNIEAAGHLVARGAELTLATAVCLERFDDVTRLAQTASARDRQVALVLAALNGKARGLATLIGLGVDLSAYSTDIYEHATALHHAVCSGNLDAVKVIVEAGAKLDATDTLHHATPLGWAEYYVDQDRSDERSDRYARIAAYLREQGAPS